MNEIQELPKGFKPGGDEFWSKAARDMAQVAVVLAGFERQELLNRLIKKITLKGHKVQERHVLAVMDEMYREQEEAK